jgi:hypothetical protein
MFDNLRKYAAAYAVAIGGVLLTCLSSWNVRQELQTSHFKEFEWAAGDRIQSVRAVVDQGLDALLEIRGLFHAAQGVDEKAFLVFTDSVLKRRPYIDSLLWAPLLTSPRQQNGTRAGSAGAALQRQGRAQRRSCACRCCFRRRATGTGVAPGVDLNATSELAALFQRARASGKVAVSGRMGWRPGRGRRRMSSTRRCRSMRRTTRRARSVPATAEPLGFVIGVYDIEELVHVAISLLEPRGVEVLVRDDSAAGDAQFLHFYASRLEPRAAATAAV